MSVLIASLVLAAAVAYGLYRYFPSATKRWFNRIQAARKTLFTIGFVATTTILLLSGVTSLMVVGFAMAVLGFVQAFILEDEQEVF